MERDPLYPPRAARLTVYGGQVVTVPLRQSRNAALQDAMASLDDFLEGK